MSQVGGIQGIQYSPNTIQRVKGQGEARFQGSEDYSSATRRSGSANLIFTLGATALLAAGAFYLFKGKLPQSVSGLLNQGKEFLLRGGRAIKGLFTEGAIGNFFKNNGVGKFIANIAGKVKSGFETVVNFIKGFGKTAASNADDGLNYVI